MNVYFYEKTPLRVNKAGPERGYIFVIFLLDKMMWETNAEGNGHKVKCPPSLQARGQVLEAGRV